MLFASSINLCCIKPVWLTGCNFILMLLGIMFIGYDNCDWDQFMQFKRCRIPWCKILICHFLEIRHSTQGEQWIHIAIQSQRYVLSKNSCNSMTTIVIWRILLAKKKSSTIIKRKININGMVESPTPTFSSIFVFAISIEYVEVDSISISLLK